MELKFFIIVLFRKYDLFFNSKKVLTVQEAQAKVEMNSIHVVEASAHPPLRTTGHTGAVASVGKKPEESQDTQERLRKEKQFQVATDSLVFPPNTFPCKSYLVLFAN